MGAMNFFRGLTAAFIVAVMGAILLATLGVVPERGGHVTVMSATAANALGIDLAHVFRGVFGLGVVCLIVSLIALIRMEERPLRGRRRKSLRRHSAAVTGAGGRRRRARPLRSNLVRGPKS